MPLPIVKDNRCAGNCCRGFVLMPPTELAHRCAKAISWLNNAAAEDETAAHRAYLEVIQIHDMVTYIGYRLVADYGMQAAPGQSAHIYDCKNLLPNGDCGIYASRPAMCRDYPYGDPCRYRDCNWRAAKAGNVAQQKADGGC